MENLFFDIVTILVGLVLGSFIGAVSYRIPRRLGFISGYSFCDNCGKELKWFNNIPVISYVYQKGKSFCCNKRISSRYPLIELASAVSVFWVIKSFPLPFSIFYCLVVLTCILIFVIDWEHQVIPDETAWILLALSFLIIFIKDLNPIPFIFSGLVASLSILSIYILTLGRGMGLGDVKLSLALGSFLSLVGVLNLLLTAFLTGGVVASILLVAGRAKWKQKIAFGPFLIVGFLYVLFIKTI